MEDFLISNQLENYVDLFIENQISIEDLPFLTKEDLIDMKLPIGPRNRLLKIIENKGFKTDGLSRNHSSPKKIEIKEEVDRFMTELSQFSKRSEPRLKNSSRNLSLDTSFDSEMNSQRFCENLTMVIKEIGEKQNFMMKAIEENQRAIALLRQEYFCKNKNRCSCSECR